MKLLADENFPPSLISYLQKKQHDVKRIQRSARGVSDIGVYGRAVKENRIIITFDKDFIIKKNLVSVRVMIFEFPGVKPENILPYLDVIIHTLIDLKRRKKHFVAVYSKNGLELLNN